MRNNNPYVLVVVVKWFERYSQLWKVGGSIPCHYRPMVVKIGSVSLFAKRYAVTGHSIGDPVSQ